MLIEIRKVGFVNKGAELMLHAVLQKMREMYPEADFVIAPSISKGPSQYLKRCELGLLQKAWLWRYGFQFGNLVSFVPKRLRDMYGIVLDKEIDIVIDAAGFSYSDQWGLAMCKELASSAKRWRRQGTKVVLLPQAFGPFQSRSIKEAMNDIADNVDLIFAREHISYEHLTGAVGKRRNIKMAPDFTNLVEGVLPDDFDVVNNRFCIVPNYRMVDKTTTDVSVDYIPFMIKCVKYLINKNTKPFILVHEGDNDLMLAEEIVARVEGNVSIVKETNPIKIKGILGACEGMLGSRFHGLVSALSQGVPALATGWSHKYKMLFEDYGFSDGVIDVTTNDDEIKKKIDLIADPDSKIAIKKTITEKSKELKNLSENMWRDVFECLNLSDLNAS